jgi:hypothetical protein
VPVLSDPVVRSAPVDEVVEPDVEEDPVSDDVLISLLVLVLAVVELPGSIVSMESPELDEQYVIPRSARIESISSITHEGAINKTPSVVRACPADRSRCRWSNLIGRYCSMQ